MTQRPRGVHVWVRPPHTPERAGLLIDWQERDGVFRALVVYWDPDGERAITDWFFGDQVRPAPCKSSV